MAAPRLPWFACRPGALLGALSGMEPHEGYLYCVILFRIYETGGPIADDMRSLSRRTGIAVRDVCDCIDRLIENTKLFRTEEGRLMNSIAADELETRKRRAKINSDNAEKRWAEKRKQNQQIDDANASSSHTDRNATAMPPHTHLHLHKQEERKEVPAPDGAADVVGEEPKARLFRIGKTILVSFGVAEKRTGALIGQWLKTRNDPVGLLAAIEFAREQNVAEPVSYISAVIAKGKVNGIQKPNLCDLARELADEARELEVAAGLHGPPLPVGSH